MTSFGSDLRFAVRSLFKTSGFTATAVLTLAIGIGAATAMFSALRALVLEPFAYPRPGELVHVWSNNGQPLSAPDFRDIREQAASFADLGAYSIQQVNLGGEHPVAISSAMCTSGVLRALGVTPRFGRLIEPSDEKSGAPPVAVISYRLWQQSFAGDPGIVGRTIRINGGNVTLVGIMPKSFEFASPWMRTADCAAWLPLQLEGDKSDRGSHWLCTIGRLKAGVTVTSADAEIKAIGARLKAAYPDTNTKKPFLVRSLFLEMTRTIRSNVWMLFTAVVLVLLVACANVASMLLARNARRQAEFGVRIALGATAGRIVRLALTESLVLSAVGAIAGIAVALAGLPLLRMVAPTTEARKAAMMLDGQALVFAVAASLLTALLAGLPPALAALRISVADMLRSDIRTASGSRTRHHLLRALVVAQVAIAFVLANGAAIFSASYAKLLEANANLATEYVLSAQVSLRGDRYNKKASRVRFCEELVDRVTTLPGVTSVGMTSKLPLEGGSNMDILVNDEIFDPAVSRTLAEVSAVTPGYFAAAGIPLLHGRTLEPSDVGEENIGVVVNRVLAEKSWPGQDPIGKVFRPNNAKPTYRAQVVGVVDNVRQWGPASDPRAEFYWTTDRSWNRTMTLVVRSPQPATLLAPALRRTLATIDPELPLSRIRTLQTVVLEATQGQRAVARLVDVFMVLALGLVAIGLYGT